MRGRTTPLKTERPEPREIRIAPTPYQPSKAEVEEEFDMPGWSLDQMRENLLGPVKLVHDENEPR